MSETSFYVDDPDAAVTYPVTDNAGGPLNWADPTVTDGTTELAAEWLGSTVTTEGVSTRDLKVPLDALAVGSYYLRLVVPDDNDIHLGTVTIVNQSGGIYPGSDCSWPVDVGCLADSWDDLSPAVRERAVALASATLRRLTAYRVGVCPITVRPMPEKQMCWTFDWHTPGLMPMNYAGRWINCLPCGQDLGCTVSLPAPVTTIVEVKIDGDVIDEADYAVLNGRSLVWMGAGECPWPRTQNINLPDTEEGTFSVTYLNAYPVDAMGAYAAGILANEFAKACSGGKCRFPATVTSITRQGVSFDVIAGSFPGGWTGIREVDAYIALWNPTGMRQPTGVWSPDVSRPAVIR